MRGLVAFALLCLTSPALSAPLAWQDLPAPEGKKDIELRSVCESGDALFFAGQSMDRGRPGIFLSRAGKKGWVKGLGHGQVQALEADGRGGLLVAGKRMPPKGYLGKAFIARYDASGRQRWFIHPATEVSGDVTRLKVHEGQILAVGVHNTRKSGESQGWLLRLDMKGKILDEQRMGQDHYHYLKALVPVGGGWLAGGAAKRDGSYHDWLLAYDGKGELKQKSLRRSKTFDGLQAACQDGAGGAYFIGLSTEKQGNMRSLGRATVTRVDGAGKALWRRKLGDSLGGVFMPRFQAGRLAFVAPEIDQTKGTGRLLLMSVDAKGKAFRQGKIPAPAIMLNYTTPGAFLIGGDGSKAELLLVDKKRGGGLRWRRLRLPWP